MPLHDPSAALRLTLFRRPKAIVTWLARIARLGPSQRFDSAQRFDWGSLLLGPMNISALSLARDSRQHHPVPFASQPVQPRRAVAA